MAWYMLSGGESRGWTGRCTSAIAVLLDQSLCGVLLSGCDVLCWHFCRSVISTSQVNTLIEELVNLGVSRARLPSAFASQALWPSLIALDIPPDHQKTEDRKHSPTDLDSTLLASRAAPPRPGSFLFTSHNSDKSSDAPKMWQMTYANCVVRI